MTGVSYDSSSFEATIAGTVGTWSTYYPASNMGDISLPTKVARVTPASGAASATFVLPGLRTIGMVALVNHGIQTGASVRVRLYNDATPSGTGADMVKDTGTVLVWPSSTSPIANNPALRPLIISPAVQAQSMLLELTGLGASPVDIGVVEMANWFAWPGLPNESDFGHYNGQQGISLVGGAEDIGDVWTPRVFDGQIDYLHMSQAATVGLDFQKSQGLANPFVFVADINDATSWPRSAYLATNVELPPSVGVLYRHDAFRVRLKEYMR